MNARHPLAPLPLPAVARRRLLQGALAWGTLAGFAAPIEATVLRPHFLRLRLEGDVDLSWVLSLHTPTLPPLPPTVAGRLRIESLPAGARPRSARDRATLAIAVFLAPAGVPAGEPAPEIAPISTIEVVGHGLLVDVADFGEPSTRPRANLLVSGTTITNPVPSPFGSLVGRSAYVALGFEWTDAENDAAVFRHVAVGAAGSHVTVLPHAAGELAFGFDERD